MRYRTGFTTTVAESVGFHPSTKGIPFQGLTPFLLNWTSFHQRCEVLQSYTATTMAVSNTTNTNDMIFMDNIMNISYWEQILAALFLSLVTITGLVGNSMIILAVAFSIKLHTATNAFVTSLSIADLLTCFTLIWYTISTLGKGEWPISGTYWICQGTGFMIYACIGTSMWTLGLIAVNRLVLIIKPAWYNKIFTSWKLVVLVTIPWVIPEVFLLIMNSAGYVHFGYNKSTLSCAVITHTLESAVAQNLVGLFLPLIAMIVSYICIYVYVTKRFKAHQHSLAKHSDTCMTDISTSVSTNDLTLEQPMTLKHKITRRRRQQVYRQQIEVTKNLFLVVCGFFACFLPYFILQLIHIGVNVEHFIFYTKFGPLASSAINFFIYASKHPDFKVVMRHRMRCSYADIPQPSRLLKYIVSRRN